MPIWYAYDERCKSWAPSNTRILFISTRVSVYIAQSLFSCMSLSLQWPKSIPAQKLDPWFNHEFAMNFNANTNFYIIILFIFCCCCCCFLHTTVFENREKMVLVMEFAAGGELYDYLSERKVLSEEEARRVFRQISTAVYYCHKHKICHRDLKLENILLDENGNAKVRIYSLCVGVWICVLVFAQSDSCLS